MNLFRSPGRTLANIVLFNLTVVVIATIAYMGAGWSFGDAFYTVGYGEVRPIDTNYLHLVTVFLMIFGCTGMILFTGALIQFLTITQIRQILGSSRMQSEIEKLKDHVIIVGFGRIGYMLARELKAAGRNFLILEMSEARAAEIRESGYLCLVGDGTHEDVLKHAGIDRARTLACVLPNDAANVFITLSARALNPKIEIIARGEVPSTENKLKQAGADKVVLPAYIGAERIAELILYPEAAQELRSSQEMQALEHSLHGIGLEMDVVIVPERGAYSGLTLGEIERRAGGKFFIVQVNRQSGETVSSADAALVIGGGDGLVIVGRSVAAAREMLG